MVDRPQLRLGFTDYFKGLDEFFVDWFSTKYEVIRDDENPEYLIFCDETFGTNNKSFDGKPVVKIFYTGENRRPWNYTCHAAIAFDHYDTPTHYRLPLYVVDHWGMVNKLGMDSIFQRNMVKIKYPIPEKTKFCCFISGNGGNEHRNKFFHLLNEYKKVDSFGPLFNNVGFVLPRGDDAAKNKDFVMQEYKFNLCFENGDFPGYCTEKLMHALYSLTIPIYSGSPTAGIDFNPGAFLSWHNSLSDNDLMDQVIKLDQNDNLYEAKYRQPMFNSSEAFSGVLKYWESPRFVQWFHTNIYPMRKQ